MEVKVYGISNRRKFQKIEKALDNAKFSCYFAHLDNGWSVSVRKPNACVSTEWRIQPIEAGNELQIG